MKNINRNKSQINSEFFSGIEKFKVLLKRTLTPKHSFNDGELVTGKVFVWLSSPVGEQLVTSFRFLCIFQTKITGFEDKFRGISLISRILSRRRLLELWESQSYAMFFNFRLFFTPFVWCILFLLSISLNLKTIFIHQWPTLFPGLAALVELYVQAINTPGVIPNVQSAWDTFVTDKCSVPTALSCFQNCPISCLVTPKKFVNVMKRHLTKQLVSSKLKQSENPPFQPRGDK